MGRNIIDPDLLSPGPKGPLGRPAGANGYPSTVPLSLTSIACQMPSEHDGPSP